MTTKIDFERMIGRYIALFFFGPLEFIIFAALITSLGPFFQGILLTLGIVLQLLWTALILYAELEEW